MIADLLERRLCGKRWGHKAARLSEAAYLGMAVPPGLCVQAGALAHAASITAVADWLGIYRPRRVALRASSRGEDRTDTAQAGRTVSVLRCPPEATAIMRVITHEVRVGEPTEGDVGGAVLVQEQIDAAFAGVAFFDAGHLLAEVGDTTEAVTGGQAPAARIRVTGDRLEATVWGRGLPVRGLANRLHTCGERLSAHFHMPVDIEWAWAGGTIVILQVRPITRRLHEPRS